MQQLQSHPLIVSTIRRRPSRRPEERGTSTALPAATTTTAGSADALLLQQAQAGAQAPAAAEPAPQREAASRSQSDGMPVTVELVDSIPSVGTRADKVIRAANVVIAAAMLLLLAPVMLLVALAVRLTSPGPVIYRQVRVGVDRRRYRGLKPIDRRNADDRRTDDRKGPGRRGSSGSFPAYGSGAAAQERRDSEQSRRRDMDRRLVQVAVSEDRRRHERRAAEAAATDRRGRISIAMSDRRSCNVYGKSFVMYKFRSMRVDAETGKGAVWAQKNDPRVTPIGGFLRKTRLDELPQLVNVLIGDMNIVGPRPERPPIVVNLVSSIAEYPIRQRTRPGITGLAQISHSYDTCLDDVRAKVRYDLEYLRRRSIAEDLRIMVMTPMVMFFKRTGQ